MMTISSRCEYACRAVLELAGRDPAQSPLTIETVAGRRHIPEKFLVHILLQLKRAGIVRSVRGAKGGYLLARPPEGISLLDIILAVDGPILQVTSSESSGSPDFAHIWREVGETITQSLAGTTIAQALEGTKAGSMYHI